MGQELIKRAVDASVFLINLTSGLIKFVMTAELVPVRYQTHNKGGCKAKACPDTSHSGQQQTFTVIPPSHLRVHL